MTVLPSPCGARHPHPIGRAIGKSPGQEKLEVRRLPAEEWSASGRARRPYCADRVARPGRRIFGKSVPEMQRRIPPAACGPSLPVESLRAVIDGAASTNSPAMGSSAASAGLLITDAAIPFPVANSLRRPSEASCRASSPYSFVVLTGFSMENAMVTWPLLCPGLVTR